MNFNSSYNLTFNDVFFSSSSSSDPLVSRRLFLLRDVQILELLIAIFVFVAIHALRQKKYQGLPVWPFLGMLPSLAFGLRGNIYEWLSDVLCLQNGTFQFRGPWFSSLNSTITCDPRNVEHLLKNRFSVFPKGSYFRDNLRDLLGDGIFNADDETWQRQRKTASIEFHSAKFRQLTTQSLFELVHKRLLPVLETSVKSSSPIDLQDVLLRLTFDNVCMIAFGVDPGCLGPDQPVIPFAKAFEDATEAAVVRFVMPTCVWKFMRYLDIGTEKKLKESIKGVDDFADEVIRTRKKELSLEGETTKRSDLLTVFMGLRDEKGESFSDKFLRDICVNFILAGRDTSSVALSWFFWLLEKNPEVEEKIMVEMCKILRQRDDHGNAEKRDYEPVFGPEEIKKMDYLQAALSEALRLYPSVPVDHKEVQEDDVFPDGTMLKKGDKVIYAIYAMGRMEAIWGKDCLEFRPERWLRDGRFMSESAYKFTAFNGGPRLCLGKDFAYYQMKSTAAAIVYRYKVKVVNGHKVEPKLALTMYMKHGLMVNLINRSVSEIDQYYAKSFDEGYIN
ncbi:Cytochrome P450 86B1 [Arabidopsis thaliana]|uniref:CYP86B1 n=3 Tax=Arabidopsis TaxID=3701 RepID=A0A178UB32_ARATH|nr:Cytochrome P450 [Arabidopsis thaliana x Arabidopsis arenosa]KAG7610119.1 Cytochrome P450 [Arabidopsis suecica]OAO90855.1 CYP86B1 [Arabidopsis thaliana]